MVDLLMGIDVGSTNTRCAVYSLDAGLVAISVCSSREALTEDGDVDGDLLFGAVLRVCRETLGQLECPFHLHGIAVACVGTRHMLVDRDSRQIFLRPGHEAVIEAFGRFMEDRDPTDYFNTTGYPPLSGFPGFQLAAAARYGSGARVDALLSVGDYVNLRLTGVRSREYSTACSMALWDYETGDWWADIVRFAGVDRGVLGTPGDSAAVVGSVLSSVCEEAGIPEGTVVYTGGHDFLCACVAGNCGDGFLNMCGTYELVVSFQSEPFRKNAGDMTHCYVDRHVMPGRFSLQYESAGAGQTEVLRKNFFRASDAEWDACFAEMNASAYAHSGGGTMFIPNDRGEFFPSERPFGKIIGLCGGSDRTALLAAMVESLTYKARLMLESQQEALGIAADRVTMLGGGSKSPRWAQIRADVFGVPVVVPKISEATALGAALLAGIGASVYGGFKDAMARAALQGITVYEPDREAAGRYSELYGMYLEELGM